MRARTFFGDVAFELAPERDFLAQEKLFVDLQNAAVAADEKRLRENTAHNPGAVHPGGFEGYAESDAVALAKDFCARGGHVRGKTPPECQFSKRFESNWGSMRAGLSYTVISCRRRFCGNVI